MSSINTYLSLKVFASTTHIWGDGPQGTPSLIIIYIWLISQLHGWFFTRKIIGGVSENDCWNPTTYSIFRMEMRKKDTHNSNHSRYVIYEVMKRYHNLEERLTTIFSDLENWVQPSPAIEIIIIPLPNDEPLFLIEENLDQHIWDGDGDNSLFVRYLNL